MLRSFNPTFAPINPIDIDGGTIDGTIIGGASAAAGTFTNLTASGTVNFTGATVSNLGSVTTADINGGTVDGTTIGASVQSTGAFTTLSATQNIDGLHTGVDVINLSSGNSGQSRIQVQTAKSNVSAAFGVFNGAVNASSYLNTGSAITVHNTDVVAHAWRSTTGATEYMRANSTGVGIGTSSFANKLQVNGSIGRTAPVTKTSNFTLADTENWIICNGSGSITVTLPAASSWTAREVMIKTIAAQTVVSASSNVVPVDGSVAGTAILAATAGKWATLVSDGTNWIIMAAN